MLYTSCTHVVHMLYTPACTCLQGFMIEVTQEVHGFLNKKEVSSLQVEDRVVLAELGYLSCNLKAYQDENVYLAFMGHCWQTWGCLVTNVGTVSDKRSSGLSFGNTQTHCEPVRDTLATSRHIGWLQTRSTTTSIQTALELHGMCMVSNGNWGNQAQLKQPWSFHSAHIPLLYTSLTSSCIPSVKVYWSAVVWGGASEKDGIKYFP